jgi:paraquat-inducible protein B
MTDPVPDVGLVSARRRLWERMSVVWLIPVAALLISLGVAWQAWVERGPVIEIIFDDAAGIAARQTELRFRNVSVGKVERVRFTESLEQVIVSVRIDPEVADFVDDSSQFWVVRPEVSSQGVTGLETVLSGVYIEGQWDAVANGTVYLHTGERIPPLMTNNQRGLRIVLRSTDGALTTAMPLLYQGVPVGRVGDAQVGDDGLSVQAEAVIFAPHDRLIRKATRFWDASGFSISLGSGGATVNFASLASLIIGGATFETFVSGSPPAEDGDVFDIFLYESDARASVFNRDDAAPLFLTAVFEGNVSGLTVGAAVELEGLRIGEVSGIDGLIDSDRFGDDNVRMVAVLAIQPARLGLTGQTASDGAIDYVATQVEQGLRARLVTGSLFSGGLKVQLLNVENAPPAVLDLEAQPYPAIPVTDSDITDVAATAQGTLTRINELPIEELLNSAISFMDNASVLVGSPEVQSVPQEISGLIADMRGVVGSDAVKAVPDQLAALMAEIQGTVADLRAVLADIRSRDAVGRLIASIDSLQLVAVDAGTALEGVPALIDQITAVAAKAEALPMEDLVTQVGGLIDNIDRLISSDDARALPRDIVATLGNLRSILTDVEGGGIIANANATLVSAREAADQIASTAAQADGALAGLPALIDQVTALTAKADALPIEDFVAQATAVLQSAESLIASDALQALPADLSAALADLQLVLTDVREAGVIENANATILSARQAADQIAAAAADLPGLIDRANALLNSAATAVAGLSETSSVVRDARDAMREVTRAAEAVAALARTIERNPNSLIFGR